MLHMRLFLLISILFLIATAQLSHAAQTDSLATLEPLQDVVQWLPADGDEWQDVTEPIEVGEGDQIQTGESGWALLTFYEGITSEILANTQVLVTALELPETEDGTFSISLDLLVGDTFNSIEVVLDDDDTFEIHTPTMTAAVRGTEYYVMTSPTGQAMIVTEEGEVETRRGRERGGDAMRVQPGQSLVYGADGTRGDILNTTLIPERPSAGAARNAEALESCGDGYCAYEDGEGLLTCRADCGSVTEFPERRPPASRTDRFDFGDAVTCLREGTCREFCSDAANADVCRQIVRRGLVNCASDAERCNTIRENLPARFLQNRDRPNVNPGGENRPGGGDNRTPRPNRPGSRN